MRAIVNCRTHVEKESLDGLLSECDWWPSLPQTDPEITSKKDEILKHVSDQDRPLVTGTFLYTIYDAETKTWGLVNSPAKHVITFRLKNPFSERLKAACSKLIADLERLTSPRKDGKHSFDFSPRIDVLEPNSENYAFSGEILPKSTFLFAITERKTEAYVGLFAFISTILLLIITSPVISHIFLGVNDTEWKRWFSGNLERCTTAMIVTTIISWFEVLLNYFAIRRHNRIRWSLE
jgi:hypothetical protein